MLNPKVCQQEGLLVNEAGMKLAEELARREYTAMEYRSQLVRMRNMDLVCHCSAEIDMGTLLYFSVNDLYLGRGNYVVLLFSEISENSSRQEEGRDVFSRMYTYAIIETVAKELLTGHYSFFSSELDGRLAFILSFPFGLLPDRSIVDYLGDNCIEISERCRERYGMEVVTYISEPIDNVHHLSAIYTKLLETATLHRYIGRRFDKPVFNVPTPQPTEQDRRMLSMRDSARALVSAVINGDDAHALARETLDAIARSEASGIDNLKRHCGDYFEHICTAAAQMGLRLDTQTLRTEQFHVLFDSVHWSEPVDWMLGFVDRLRESSAESGRLAARRRFDEAVGFINRELADPGLTVERCAAAAGCSVSALAKLFHRHRDMSVAQYIRERRLEQAYELLREGCGVGQTCERCGFGSTETFHRAFKARYGITPGRLRRGAEGETTADNGADTRSEP